MNDLKQYQPKEIKQLKPDRQLNMVRFSPCGKVLAAAGYDATIRRWDGESFADLPAVVGHGGWVQALAFHPDAHRLFAVDSWGKLACWNYADKDAKPVWAVDQAHDGWVRGLSLSADGKLLATCGKDQLVRLWSDDGKKIKELAGHDDDVLAVACHPDGKSVVSGDLHGNVRQWDVETGKTTRTFDAKVLYRLDRLQDTGGVRVLAFNADGTQLAVAGMTPKNGGSVQGVPTILLFDWTSGKLIHTLKMGNDGDGYVHDLHFHPAGFVMAVSSGNPGVGKFYFHQPGQDQPFFTASKPNCHALAVHPNGTRLVISTTNGGSNGNGRQPGKEYPGNFSPLFVYDMPTAKS